MGTTQSSTQTASTLAKNITSSSSSQTINIECTGAVDTAVCSTQSRNTITVMAKTNPSTALEQDKIKSDSCSAEPIATDMNVQINTDAIADNSIVTPEPNRSQVRGTANSI